MDIVGGARPIEEEATVALPGYKNSEGYAVEGTTNCCAGVQFVNEQDEVFVREVRSQLRQDELFAAAESEKAQESVLPMVLPSAIPSPRTCASAAHASPMSRDRSVHASVHSLPDTRMCSCRLLSLCMWH